MYRRFHQSITWAILLSGAVVCRAHAQDAQVSRLRSRPAVAAEKATPGLSRVPLAGGREGMLYVPSGYRPDRPAPLLVLLHGATQSAELWTRSPVFVQLADELGLVLLMPNSYDTSWDLMRGGFGRDVPRLDSSLAQVFRRCNIDRGQIALGGFSDGASYALSLGVANGDLFSALIAFSPGFFAPERRNGKPRIFITHGTADRILPIDRTSHQIQPQLESQGYQVS